MAKQQKPAPSRCAPKNCACDKCFKAKPEDEKKAAVWWRELYNKNGWPKDALGYL
jgi:hypothetical protein